MKNARTFLDFCCRAKKIISDFANEFCIVRMNFALCALCKILNSEMSKFELISVIFPREMLGIAKSMGELHWLCNDKHIEISARFFCLSDGDTALHLACKSFLAEADACTLFRFWGKYGNQKCVEILAKREDLDANIKNKWHFELF